MTLDGMDHVLNIWESCKWAGALPAKKPFNAETKKEGGIAMGRDVNYFDLSELEKEFEIEMEKPDELEFEEGLEGEFEEEPEQELEDIQEESTGDYAQRFFELSQREFESETELDDAIDGPLRKMEEEFFLDGLRKGWKQLKSKGLGRLLKKGFSFAAGKIPALQALKNVAGAARSALKGDLKGLVKAGLGAALRAHPAGAALSPALRALGFEAGEDNRDAWDNVVNVAREANDYLVANLHENIDDPLEASRLANEAFQAGLRKAKNAAYAVKAQGKPYRVIRVGRGERIKIIIEGV